MGGFMKIEIILVIIIALIAFFIWALSNKFIRMFWHIGMKYGRPLKTHPNYKKMDEKSKEAVKEWNQGDKIVIFMGIPSFPYYSYILGISKEGKLVILDEDYLPHECYSINNVDKNISYESKHWSF